MYGSCPQRKPPSEKYTPIALEDVGGAKRFYAEILAREGTQQVVES